MGWNINIETGVDVSKNDIETAISELPENMANGFGKQSWGWSLAVDLRIRSPREIGLSGSYSISGKIAQPFADALAERLRGQGISCEVGELHQRQGEPQPRTTMTPRNHNALSTTSDPAVGSTAWLGSPTRILSLGAGVQSSTLALMAATGDTEYRLDAAIFADTQAEPDDVYRWLDWLESEIKKLAYPFPVLRVTKGSLTEASLRVRTSKQTGLNYLKHSIPAYMKRANGAGGIMGRACTLDFKIIPVQQAAKKIAKVKRGQKTATAEIWIGISRDEAHRMKPSREPWAVHVWPLIDAGMNRKDCLAWMESRGYPKPPRSSCAYCPYHSDKEWLRLKSDEPEAFAAAVAYETRLQASVSQICRLDGVPYLHPSRVPLASVDFNPTSTEPSLFGNECEGMCGV